MTSMKVVDRKVLDELEYLRFFIGNVDLGPADDDIVRLLNEDYVEQTGKQLPEGY